jgi:hypothetical protein
LWINETEGHKEELSTIYGVHSYRPGQIVRYIRTGAIYLLIEEAEISMLSPHFFRGTGYGFRALVLFAGRSYPAQGGQTVELFILRRSEYYEILSDATGSAAP